MGSNHNHNQTRTVDPPHLWQESGMRYDAKSKSISILKPWKVDKIGHKPQKISILLLLVDMCGNPLWISTRQIEKIWLFFFRWFFLSHQQKRQFHQASQWAVPNPSYYLNGTLVVSGNLKQQIHQSWTACAFQEASRTSPGLSQGGKKETTNQHDVHEAKLQCHSIQRWQSPLKWLQEDLLGVCWKTTAFSNPFPT